MIEWLGMFCELLVLVALIALVHLGADMRLIIEVSTLYLAMVIRNQKG